MHYDLYMNFIIFIRCGFIIPTVLILIVDSIPVLSQNFVTYGPRTSLTSKKHEPEATLESHNHNHKNIYQRLIYLFSSLCVPHHWFKHFYIVSVASSLFWAYQLCFNGYIFQLVAAYSRFSSKPDSAATFDLIALLWLIMLAQGCRRLYECIYYYRPSKSSMWIGHWAIGIWFYLLMNIAIWVEFVPTIQKIHLVGITNIDTAAFPLYGICTIAIAFLMYRQNRLHYYLSSLPGAPNYQVPDQMEFSTAIVPHYYYEIFIYAVISFLASLATGGLHKSLISAGAFVTVNLLITAKGTKQWYIDRFGEKYIIHKHLIIPTGSETRRKKSS